MTSGNELSGKVALVTGGARNIGRSISLALAQGGASVMVNARTSVAEASETVKLIESAGGKAALHVADVTVEKEVAKLVEGTVKQFGRIDYLINNASIRPNSPIETISPEEWRDVLAVGLDAAFICSRACLPHLRAAGAASIVNLGGLTGRKGATQRAHVVTVKAGIEGFTR